MKTTVKIFEFISYKFEPKKKKIFFNYKIEFARRKPLLLTEAIILPKIPTIKNLPKGLLDNLLQGLHIILGVSYYKIYCPPKVKLNKPLSQTQADFWNIVYRKGLGEFCYHNKIDPKKIAKFPYDKNLKVKSYELARKDRSLVGIGGGKDSIVAAELLKEQKHDIAAFVVETQRSVAHLVKKVIKKLGIKSLVIRRVIDNQLFQEQQHGYQGHIPLNAMLAFLGIFTAILYDYSYIIMGNEQSSNFGNIRYRGEVVNHQWSKSAEFENFFQNYVKNFLTPNITYFSLLRPFYEIRIVEMFAKYKKYFSYFSSCNKNFKIKQRLKNSFWCGECPKCVFVFTLLAAFLSKKELLSIFGKNLFNNKNLLLIFRDLLGFGKLKPFECVGTFEETRAALYLASKKFKNNLVIKKFLPRIKGADQLVEQVFKTNPASGLPEKFRFLGLKNILLLGYAKEGKMTHRYIKQRFPKLKIGIADSKKNGPNYLDQQKHYDLAIKTPGLPKDLVTIPYTTATNIFFSQVKNLVIGVTGTKGKSTTVSLIHAILKEAGKKVHALGNIGEPMLGALLRPIDQEEIFVLELSSYQLDDIKFSPQIAVILDLFPDHLNYHGDVQKYYAAKKNIINFQRKQDFFVYNAKYKQLIAWAKRSSATAIPYNKTVSLLGIEVPLIGQHNQENTQAAIAVAELLNIPRLIIKEAIKRFKALPHRLEFIGEFSGIKFYDDAISTTPESTIMAIKSLKNIGTILLGGEDRGYDFCHLERIIKQYKIKNIVLFPETGKRMFKSKKGLEVLSTASMAEAVKFAFQKTVKGKICLLSTASPSYSLWKNFEEKGDQFQRFIKKGL